MMCVDLEIGWSQNPLYTFENDFKEIMTWGNEKFYRFFINLVYSPIPTSLTFY